ncbi:MAG: hypothetical protein LKJ88_08720 [Bacilli bacterium]|nr:hypothetical protein [Bacilli bacterium]
MLDSLIYQNYIDLLGSDEKAKMRALVFKRLWIFDHFFIPYTLEKDKDGIYAGIDCLLHEQIQLSKFEYRSIETAESKAAIDAFNSKFRYIKIFTSLPISRNHNTFYAEADFHHLDKSDYKKLVASFFWCLSPEVFKDKFPSGDLRTIFQHPCEGKKGEAVIIVKKDFTENLCRLNVDGFRKIFIFSDMSDAEKHLLEGVSKKMNLRSVNIHV